MLFMEALLVSSWIDWYAESRGKTGWEAGTGSFTHALVVRGTLYLTGMLLSRIRMRSLRSEIGVSFIRKSAKVLLCTIVAMVNGRYTDANGL